MQLNTPFINRLVDAWLEEDLGAGDLTAITTGDKIVYAHWIAKQNGVFCGGPLIAKIFNRLNKLVRIDLLIAEGAYFETDEKILTVSGPASALLAGERTALNLAMHLSGIATETKKLVKDLEGTGVSLTDTRKTTPGLRLLEKYAVRCGGGINHRMGLDDAAMLKENHIAWSKGIAESIQLLRTSIPWTTKIIVEAETARQAEEAVLSGADGILLDEMAPEQLLKLVPRLRKLAIDNQHSRKSSQILLEVSGINPKEIKKYASLGIDIISSSAPITKSTWIDFSMRFNPIELNQ